ncbi:MAG: chorismate synthase [Anaerolineae bacterium]|jgi:chorismate synthase
MLRFLTAGESHGPSLTAILEGIPAGLSLTPDDLQPDMRRRQKGYGSGGRMGIEKDAVHITGGVMGGQTTGGPIALHIGNRDWDNWRDKDIPPMTIPRPGHADLTGAIKYGYRDLRLALERASARETAARVAVGAVCRHLLRQFDLVIGSYVVSIGDVTASLPLLAGDAARRAYLARFEAAETNDVRCPDPEAAERMRQAIFEAMQAKDTLGGVFEVVALGVPPGLGSHVHWDRRLDARLLWAVGSIQAVKGVEIGPAFENTRLRGTQVHDEIFADEGEDASGDIEPETPALTRHTNRAGGFEGGITTGQPILVRGAMKPISTTLTPLRSVDLASGQPAATQYERSDFCAVPRAAVVGEAMVALVLADALIEKLGGDSLAEMHPRFEALRRGRLDELPMDGATWRFGYE